MLPTKSKLIIAGVVAICVAAFSFSEKPAAGYYAGYTEQLQAFKNSQQKLLQIIEQSDLQQLSAIEKIKTRLQATRDQLKGLDFWFRYLEPTVYKMINGPLPVEWETEVFEKFEKPYKRNGAGLTLAALYLDEEGINKDSLAQLIRLSLKATETLLSADPLQLSSEEKNNLLQFIRSLTEDIVFETPPQQLPVSKIKALNNRKPGGEY